MPKLDVEHMDFNELWLLHEELTRILAKKISAEKSKLEQRLAQLSLGETAGVAGPVGLLRCGRGWGAGVGCGVGLGRNWRPDAGDRAERSIGAPGNR